MIDSEGSFIMIICLPYLPNSIRYHESPKNKNNRRRKIPGFSSDKYGGWTITTLKIQNPGVSQEKFKGMKDRGDSNDTAQETDDQPFKRNFSLLLGNV